MNVINEGGIAMNSKKRISGKIATMVLSIAVTISLVSCFAPKGDPENGRRWYSMNNCSSCHGEGGRNGMAPDIAGLKLGFSSFMKNIRNPDSVSKPRYSEANLPEQDAIDIYLWLKKNH
jgi:hypothetical protein